MNSPLKEKMEEVENQSVTQEIAQEVANPQTETDQIATEATQQESRQDRNWRELRRQKDELERKTRMQDELLQRLMSQQAPSQAAAHSPEEDIIQDLAKEDYVPGEKVAKAFRKLEDKFERKVQEMEKRNASHQQNSMFNDLKREFPDFDEVVNSDTLALLEETNPRLANTIAATKDPYAIAVQSYEYIKAKGLSSKAPSKRVKETEAKIEANKKTIQSPAAFEKRPMAQAFQMNDAMKKELASEMYHYAQQAGMGY